MMESLFGYASTERNNHNKKDSSSQSPPRFIQIIDAKKAQNLAILLKALNVTTEEVCDAIQEGSVCVPLIFALLFLFLFLFYVFIPLGRIYSDSYEFG